MKSIWPGKLNGKFNGLAMDGICGTQREPKMLTGYQDRQLCAPTSTERSFLIFTHEHIRALLGDQ